MGGTRRYLLIATVFGAIVALIDAGFLWLIGVPLPLLWGLLAFITGYIPNVGFMIGLIPPALLALLEGGPGLMAAVIVAYAVINFIVQSVIQPKFVAKAVDLSFDRDVPVPGLLDVRHRPRRRDPRGTADAADEVLCRSMSTRAPGGCPACCPARRFHPTTSTRGGSLDGTRDASERRRVGRRRTGRPGGY